LSGPLILHSYPVRSKSVQPPAAPPPAHACSRRHGGPTTRAVETLKREPYINLDPCRRGGVGIRTPVWFAILIGKLYVVTGGASAKVNGGAPVPRPSHAGRDPIVTIRVPTGDKINGNDVTSVSPDYEFWANWWRGLVLRGGMDMSIPDHGSGARTAFLANFAPPGTTSRRTTGRRSAIWRGTCPPTSLD